MSKTLYSYCISYDDGAAPNPFWGLCTLAICKPKIRKVAKIGDWIAGTGSSKNGFQGQLVYAMEVTDKMTFAMYDKFCTESVPEKIPIRGLTKDLRRKVGDCIYGYSTGTCVLRDWGVHNLGNMKRDLSGEYILMSNNFYYFGSNPVPLPQPLQKIVRQGQGHKSKSNQQYVDLFIEWITLNFNKQKNTVSAAPYGLPLFVDEKYKKLCGQLHLEEDEADETFDDE